MKKRFVRSDSLYYKLIVAACLFVLCVSIGITSNASGVFVVPISEDLGFSRASVGMISTILMLSCAASVAFGGVVYKRFSLMKLYMLGVILMGASFTLYSACKELYQFYVLSAIIGIVEPYAITFPFTQIINNWYYERTGTAMGIASMGTGIGGMIFGYLSGRWVTGMGWRMTYLTLGLIMLVVLIAMGLFILREKPEDVGMKPFGVKKEAVISDEGSLPFAKYKFSPMFLFMCLAMFAQGAGSQALVSIQTPNLQSVGYSAVAAATVLAISNGTLAACKFCLGVLIDKVGIKRSTFISVFVMMAAMTFYMLAGQKFLLPAVVIFMGFACSFTMVGFPLIVRHVFGIREYTSFYGIASCFNSVGAALMPTLSGLVYDKTGSYVLFFGIMIAVVATCLITYAFMYRKRAKISEMSSVS